MQKMTFKLVLLCLVTEKDRSTTAQTETSHANIQMIYIQANIAVTFVFLLCFFYLMHLLMSSKAGSAPWHLHGCDTYKCQCSKAMSARQSCSPGVNSMMCRFAACAWGEQTPQLWPLSGQRGCVGRKKGKRLRDRRRVNLGEMLLSCSGDHARLPRWQAVSTVLLSAGEGEQKKRGGGREVGENRRGEIVTGKVTWDEVL